MIVPHPVVQAFSWFETTIVRWNQVTMDNGSVLGSEVVRVFVHSHQDIAPVHEMENRSSFKYVSVALFNQVFTNGTPPAYVSRILS
jgi:hypothetical protein